MANPRKVGTQKVTVTLSVATVDQVRRLVTAGQAASVSGFVQHAVGVALDDVAGWGSALSEALAGTGGELSAQERAWADSVLDTVPDNVRDDGTDNGQHSGTT